MTLQLVTNLLRKRVERERDRNSADAFLSGIVRLIKSEDFTPRDTGSDLGRVPVPISVVGWNGKITLTSWLIDRLRVAYNIPRWRAAALVEQGYLLPVIDGLDEAAGTDAGAEAPLRILNRLNTEYGVTDASGRRPLVLTCRTASYRDLPEPGGRRFMSRRLSAAVSVSILPLTETEVVDYLTQQADMNNSALRPLILEIIDGEHQVIVTALTSPLILALAVRVARAGSLDMTRLTSFPTVAAVRGYFISRYPVSTAMLYPRKFARASIAEKEQSLDAEQGHEEAYYRPAAVQHWLYQIASLVNMERTASPSGHLVQPEFSPADIWKAAQANGRPVRQAHMVIALLAALLTGTFGAEVADGGAGYAFWLGATVLAVLFALRVGLPRKPGLSRVDFRQLTNGKAATYLLPLVLTAGVLAGLLGFRVSREISVAVTEGVAGMALAALLAGRSRGPARAVEPLDGLSNDLRFGLVVGVVGAIALGFPGGLTGGLWSHLGLVGTLSRPGSEVLAFLIAIPCGVALGSGGWVRVQLAAALSRGSFLPGLPILFLRWAEATGLLRAAGTNYQFRHDDLRKWLLEQGD